MNLNECKKTPFAWPGGYQILALMNDGEAICNSCVNLPEVHEGGDADGWRFEDAFIYWEGLTMFCAHCNKELESEYGDPKDNSTLSESVD